MIKTRPARLPAKPVAASALAAALVVTGLAQRGARQPGARISDPAGRLAELRRTPEEWRARLTPEQFRVTRLGADEPAYTGRYWANRQAGRYYCVCCGNPLFSARDQAASGDGWPDFRRPLDSLRIRILAGGTGAPDREIRCRRCGAHLGDLAGGDGGAAWYRINSAALSFIAQP